MLKLRRVIFRGHAHLSPAKSFNVNQTCERLITSVHMQIRVQNTEVCHTSHCAWAQINLSIPQIQMNKAKFLNKISKG